MRVRGKHEYDKIPTVNSGDNLVGVKTTAADPVGANDDTQGYYIGYVWNATTSGKAFVCLDASTGAAVWTEISKLTAADIKTLYESNADTNAYTDAEQTKVGHLTVTQAVDLDTMESDIATNNAKTGVTTEISNVVEDTTPQLGGTLDTNSKQVRLSKGADVASAAALTLGDTGNYFDVTGTTTITSIATKAVGTVVKLHFDGAVTLTHHATDLILPNSANYTTAAGDEFEFTEYAAGDWRCTGYVLASGEAIIGGAGGASWTKVTKAYTDFTAAALTESITLFSLAAGQVLKGIFLKHTTAWAGASWTNANLSVGISGDEAKYLTPSDVDVAVADTTFYGAQNFDMINWGAATNILLTLDTIGGNISGGTAGAVEVYYLVETVKS